MNLIELQNALGVCLTNIANTNLTEEEIANNYKQADMTARIAKQMINNADVILRTDKMRQSQGLDATMTSSIVGYND